MFHYFIQFWTIKHNKFAIDLLPYIARMLLLQYVQLGVYYFCRFTVEIKVMNEKHASATWRWKKYAFLENFEQQQQSSNVPHIYIRIHTSYALAYFCFLQSMLKYYIVSVDCMWVWNIMRGIINYYIVVRCIRGRILKR